MPSQNAETCGRLAASESLWRKPITGADCCALAESGHIAAAPRMPSSSRRSMGLTVAIAATALTPATKLADSVGLHRLGDSWSGSLHYTRLNQCCSNLLHAVDKV